MITLIDMPYAKYFEGAQFVHFLLGTATVALAVPIYKGLEALRGRILPLLAALLAGGATSIVSAVGIAKLLGADAAIIGGFYAKSVTAPIAMGVAERINVSPTLTAVFAVTTGILGAILVRFVMDAIGMKSWWQRGFAVGVAAHGIGTSRAFSVHPRGGHLREPRDGVARRAGRGADSAGRRSDRFHSRAAEGVAGYVPCGVHRGSAGPDRSSVHRKSFDLPMLGTVDVRLDAGLTKAEWAPPSRRSWHPCRSR